MMRTVFSTFFVNGRPLLKSCTMLSHLGCLGVLASVSLAAAQADDLQSIRDAWQKRHDAIKSFHYECELEESRKVGATSFNGLFGKPADKDGAKEQIVLQSDLSYSMANGRIALSIIGEDWDDRAVKRIPKELLMRYTGSDLITFINERSIQLANVEVGVEALHSDIVQFVTVTPVWFWYWPEPTLSNSGYLLDKATISGQDIVVHAPDRHDEGVKCIE
jgi:hypothetical protein